MTIYDDLQDTATELYAEYAQGTVKLVHPTKTVSGGRTWDPAAGAASETIINAVVRRVEQKYVDGALIVGSEMQVMFSGANDAPALDDKIEIGGVNREIVSIMPNPGSGTVVSYTVIVRS